MTASQRKHLFCYINSQLTNKFYNEENLHDWNLEIVKILKDLKNLEYDAGIDDDSDPLVSEIIDFEDLYSRIKEIRSVIASDHSILEKSYREYSEKNSFLFE